VGKSLNLKDRILSHFSAQSREFKEHRLAQNLTAIDTLPTAGDLHAQLLESSLIKSLKPLFNRQLRYAKN